MSILDPDLMRTLVCLHQEESFTKAGERLGLTQQAISAQVKRIEIAVDRQVVRRRGNRIQLTNDGEALLAYARQVMDISERVRRHFSATKLAGRVRIGVLEGFATVGLPIFLASLRTVQPDLEIVVETGITERLLLRQDHGGLDLVLGAQRRGQARGETLWNDYLKWFGDAEPFRAEGTNVRLALPPEPSLVRAMAIEALTRAGRSYTIVFESESRPSLRAAAMSGIALTVFCSFDETAAATAQDGLPQIEPIEYFLRVTAPSSDRAGEIARLMREAAETVLRTNVAPTLWIP